jgi:hypothetical protein
VVQAVRVQEHALTEALRAESLRAEADRLTSLLEQQKAAAELESKAVAALLEQDRMHTVRRFVMLCLFHSYVVVEKLWLFWCSCPSVRKGNGESASGGDSESERRVRWSTGCCSFGAGTTTVTWCTKSFRLCSHAARSDSVTCEAANF